MKVIRVRNVHDALPAGIEYLYALGRAQGSRNGPVIVAPEPVTTVYERPVENLVFWPDRDVNVAFLIYEALWMLAGRNDLAGLQRYVSTFDNYSDDGVTLHGAYGYRWRHHFYEGSDLPNGDQLRVIIERLGKNYEDRRSVLAMWDAASDLHPGDDWKDLPCNLIATFQRGSLNDLNMVVFNRSNDIIWGAYFANAFHFSMLQQYIARHLDCSVGTYEQVSVNYHAYVKTLQPLCDIPHHATSLKNPYAGEICPTTFENRSAESLDYAINWLLNQADNGCENSGPILDRWVHCAWVVLRAHHLWKTLAAPERFDTALNILETGDPKSDWIVAMKRWVMRRRVAWETKMKAEA
jgi:thymidylate synthase